MNLLSYFVTPPKKLGFDDVLYAITQPNYILINTLPITEQDYLIQNTMPCVLEEKRMNELMNSGDKDRFIIIIYGKNSMDDTVDKKYHQICDLGFSRSCVYVYTGGLFEWCLLQDIHGKANFPTMGSCRDILRFKPDRVFHRFPSLLNG
jgi:hypothetical protein